MTSLRERENPRREPSFPGLSQRQLGMYVGLVSLGVLFLASLVGYIVTRVQAVQWRDVTTPPLPAGLFVSTGVLLGLSFCLHWAERGLRRNQYAELVRGELGALVLALLFLLAQIQNWRMVFVASLSAPAKSLYQFTFYMLTALHALHVLAGLVPLSVVYWRARQHSYSSSNFEGVALVRQYWDFLLAVWLVLLSVLWLVP